MGDQALPGAASAASGHSTLDRLEQHFDKHGRLPNGTEFIKAADVVHRLNVVLGLPFWHHSVLREGYDQESDTLWCYGQLVGTIDGEPFVREAYGGQALKRFKVSDKAKELGMRGDVVNWGDDRKAAQTDSLKKCAKQLGVGGYMDDPEERAEAAREQQARRAQPRQQQPAVAPPVATLASGSLVDTSTGEVLVCADCKRDLWTVKFKDNSTWDAAEMARRSRARFGGVVYCIDDYRARSEARARDTASKIPALRTGAEYYPGEGG